jgi:hypothetical protein
MQGTEQKREASLEDIRRVAKILAKATSNNENEATIAIKAAYARMRRDGVTIVDLLTLPLQDLYQKPLERLIPIVMADSKGLTPAQRKIAIDALLHVVREKFSPIPKSHQSEPPRPPPPPPQPPPNTRDEQRREYEKRRQSEESARRAGQGRAAPPPPPPPPPRPPPERPKPPPMAQEPRETVPYHYVRPANPVRGGATVGYAALFLFVLYLFWGNVGISGSKPAAATVPEASAVSWGLRRSGTENQVNWSI